MKFQFITLILFLCKMVVIGQPKIEYNKAIEPYVSFLQQQHTNAVDYVLNLFDKNDIVVIGERYHAESTQYDFIYELVSDPRFYNQVGYIFTEIGSSLYRDSIEQFMNQKDLSPQEVEKQVRYWYQESEDCPWWDKNNFDTFIQKLYFLNNKLSSERKIHLLFSDMPFTWQGQTMESVKKYNNSKSFLGRDSVMAQQIIPTFNALSPKRKKALIIMNSSHSYHSVQSTKNYFKGVCSDYLFEVYKGKIANVLLNAVKFVSEGDAESLLQQGRWDASFYVTNNRSVGFDFKNTPFGKDTFDIYYKNYPFDYGSMYSGFVFYKPFYEHLLKWNSPNTFDEEFKKKYIERSYLYNEGKEGSKESAKEYVNSFDVMPIACYYSEIELYLKQMNKWLKKPAEVELDKTKFRKNAVARNRIEHEKNTRK